MGRKPCRGKLDAASQPAHVRGTQAVHTHNGRRLQPAHHALQKLGCGKACIALYPRRKRGYGPQRYIVPGVRVFAQMACDEHAVRGFGAKGVRGDGPVAHSGYQDKPLLGQQRAQLAGNGPYIGLVAVVDGGELGHIQRDVPSFGAAQAAALDLHPRQADARRGGREGLDAAGDAPAGFGIQFGGDIGVHCHEIPSFRAIMRLFERFFQKKACLAGQKVVL